MVVVVVVVVVVVIVVVVVVVVEKSLYTVYSKMMLVLVFSSTVLGKHQALSREVMCNFRLYIEIGWTSVNPNLKH